MRAAEQASEIVVPHLLELQAAGRLRFPTTIAVISVPTGGAAVLRYSVEKHIVIGETLVASGEQPVEDPVYLLAVDEAHRYVVGLIIGGELGVIALATERWRR